MNYILESFFIGIYSVIILYICRPFITNYYVLLLVVGFLKHLLGYYLYIHQYYCNYGDTCKKQHNSKKNYVATNYHIILDSLLESIMFLVLGSLLALILTNPKQIYIIFFFIGVLLHIIAEKVGIHALFCKTNCLEK